MKYAEEMENELLTIAKDDPEFWNGGMGAYLDCFVPMAWHVMIRFGKWKEIISRDASRYKAKVTH